MFTFDIPVPNDAQAAVRQAIRNERAIRIIAEGYTFHFDEQTETVDVIKPGRLAAEYTIWLGGLPDGRKICDCPDMMKTGEPCKHYIAAAIVAKDREEAYNAHLVAEYEATYGNAECATGCDPYYELD